MVITCILFTIVGLCFGFVMGALLGSVSMKSTMKDRYERKIEMLERKVPSLKQIAEWAENYEDLLEYYGIEIDDEAWDKVYGENK